MEDNVNRRVLDLNVLKTLSEILGKHGKTDEEIKELLEFHFQVNSATMDAILSARNHRHQKRF